MPSNPNSRRQIRLVLISIVLATIPCYCLGLFAASLAPDRGLSLTGTPTSTVTTTPTLTMTLFPSLTLSASAPAATGTPTLSATPTLTPTPTQTPIASPTASPPHLHRLGHAAAQQHAHPNIAACGYGNPNGHRAAARRELRHTLPLMGYPFHRNINLNG